MMYETVEFEPSLFLFKETGTPYLALTERHLQILWFEQKALSPLTTGDGMPIEIIHPGTWNISAEGPAFLDAHVRIGKHAQRGNIVVSASLLPKEPAILYVTFEYSPLKVPLSQSIFLQNFLTEPLDKWMASVDLDAYPYKQFQEVGRCADELFAHISEERIIQILTSAAQWRKTQGSSNPLDLAKLDYLKHRFFSSSKQGEILNEPLLNEGAQQLHKDYCQHYGGDCMGCPFVKRTNFVG